MKRLSQNEIIKGYKKDSCHISSAELQNHGTNIFAEIARK